MRLPNGQVLQFEVRFGAAAKSQRMPQGSPSGICQVNLANGSTRVVEAPTVAAPAAAAGPPALPAAPPPPMPAAPPPPAPAASPAPSRPGAAPSPAPAQQAAGQAQADRLAKFSSPTAPTAAPAAAQPEPQQSPPPSSSSSAGSYQSGGFAGGFLVEPWETVRARLIATGKWRLATQGELNNSNAALEGQTIHVAGLGEGKVVKFLKNGGWGVHSAHTIDFSSPAFDGSDVREVKLKRKSNNETEWLKAVTEVRPRKTFSVTAAVFTPPTFVCIRMII